MYGGKTLSCQGSDCLEAQLRIPFPPFTVSVSYFCPCSSFTSHSISSHISLCKDSLCRLLRLKWVSLMDSDSMVSTGRLRTLYRPTAGVIKRIRLENFMCHSNLEIELGEWVNFITGQNGSQYLTILLWTQSGLGLFFPGCVYILLPFCVASLLTEIVTCYVLCLWLF